MGVLLVVLSGIVSGGSPSARLRAQEVGDLAGAWTLNRAQSEMPREMGFNVDWMPAPERDASTAGRGGRGRRGAGGTTPFSPRRESYEEGRRLQMLTTEARNPASRLIIIDTWATVTVTNDLGQSRVLHPNGREETIEIEGVPIPVTTTRDGDRVVVVYHAAQDRDIRYTYSRAPSPAKQMFVEVQFLEHGEGDKARRVYDPALPSTDTPPTPPSPTAPSPPAPASAATAPASAATPATGARETFDSRPGAELRGLKNLGILVEELGTTATACGLNRRDIETALSKRLGAGGFTVRANSDEDTYVYVNVQTTSLSNGTCVSRYDAYLYTHATANLSYRDQPVLVQVSLMHRGGLGTSPPVSHAASVTRALENYADLFVTQIQNANR